MKIKRVVLLVLGTMATITLAIFKIGILITIIVIKITLAILLVPLIPIALFLITGLFSGINQATKK